MEKEPTWMTTCPHIKFLLPYKGTYIWGRVHGESIAPCMLQTLISSRPFKVWGAKALHQR
jgi:hypothetical protein